MNIDSVPGRASSAAYRACTEDAISNIFKQIRIYSATNNISMEEARKKLLEGGQVDKWEIIPLEGKDAQVGDTFTSEHPPQVVCISRIKESVYNDTVVVIYTVSEDDQKKFEIVTYMRKKTNSNLVTHSGDIGVDYGLQHIICFKQPNQPNQPMEAYIISTPWKGGKSLPVRELEDSNPIFEIRTENNTELKRTVIPQDYDGTTDEQTACVNAKVSYNGELWTVTIERKPIKGFASDPDTLIEEIKKLENN